MAAIGQWHLQRVPACPLVLFYVYHRKMNRREHCRNIKIWTKPYLSRSPSLAVYNMLIQELYAEDVAGFKNYLHMDQTCFNELSQIIKRYIQKQDTNKHKNIPASEKLAPSLRYLMTGDFIAPWFSSIHPYF